jgi:hypothetical protein
MWRHDITVVVNESGDGYSYDYAAGVKGGTSADGKPPAGGESAPRSRAASGDAEVVHVARMRGRILPRNRGILFVLFQGFLLLCRCCSSLV